MAAAVATPWPTFLILGTAKAGTTALYRWLQQHPAVYLPANKQPHLWAGIEGHFRGPGDAAFNRDVVTDPQAYLRLFEPGAERTARGEASPFYLYYAARAIPRLHAALPECRLVVLLRQPIARAYSGYLHLVRDGRETASFPAALATETERQARGFEPLWAHRALGFYGLQLDCVLAAFPRAQVGIWLYEDLAAAPARVFAEVCRHIGVDDHFVPRFSHHNTGGRPTHPGLHALLVRLKAPHIAKRLLPEPAAQWIVARYLHHDSPPAEAAADLQAGYRPDQALLRRLLPDMDFSAWGDLSS